MGKRGPVPKRSSERRRRNKESKPETVSAIVEKVAPPRPNSRWHPAAKRWYLSLADSGQSQFYEPSDWAAAAYVAEAMSVNLRQTTKFSSVLFASVFSAMSDLLTTEASRRRVRLEVERSDVPAAPASVTAIADYRRDLGVSGS